MKTVILMSGKINCGKNQLADYIKEDLNARGLSVSMELFARSLKDECRTDFRKLSDCLTNIHAEVKANLTSLFSAANFSQPEIELRLRDVDKSLDKLLIQDKNWYEDKTDITRNILQLYGTDIFRKRVDEDWWAKKLRNRVVDQTTIDGRWPFNVSIVTDCRFPNEITVFADDVKSLNINLVLIRVDRTINTPKEIAEHASEVALDGWSDWTYTVDNNGSLDDLRSASKSIVTDLVEEYEYV